MFRIDKQLVQQHAQPADIPLIPVPLPAEEPVFEDDLSNEALEDKVAAANMEAANTHAQSRQILEEAQQKAAKILQDAQQQATLILQQAEEQATQQAEAIRADAWQSGLEEGRHEGQQQALAEQNEWLSSSRQQLQELLGQISAGREEMYALMEGEIIDLALAIAGKITHHVTARDKEALSAMMQAALGQMGRESKITIQVNQQQYNAFFAGESANFVLGGEEINVSIVGNPELKPGALLLESDEETINAGVDSQLKRITLAFGRPWEPSL